MKLELGKSQHFYEFLEGAKPGSVYVDVGAFDGEVLRFARQHQPQLKCLAIEPQPYYANLLRQANVKVVQTGCSDRVGRYAFYRFDPPYQGCSTVDRLIASNFDHRFTKEEIEVKRLDTILTEEDITNVDFLKVDVEGHEEEVLQGFTLYHPGTRFHIEYHGGNLANILLQLKEMNVEPILTTLWRDNGNAKGLVLGVAT